MFYVGQKVVRIGGSDSRKSPSPPVGEIVTVSWTAEYLGREVIDLVEYPSPAEPSHWRRGYYAMYFRPAVERKTSIEIFTRMLNPSKERETVT